VLPATPLDRDCRGGHCRPLAALRPAGFSLRVSSTRRQTV